MMESKKIFETLKSLTKNYCLVKGLGEIIKTDAGFVLKDFTDESYVRIAGLFAEDLIKQAFTEEFECDVEKEGVYEFTALLNYSAAQIGDYPPPNIECQEYMTVDYIEYKFICSHEEAKQQQKELNSSTNAQLWHVSPHGSNSMLEDVTVDRITPENITSIAENEVFVFGSNLSGRHGKGAAKTALGWGAKWGQAAGIQGKTYGIPTKDAAIKRTLRIDEIKPFVDDFIEWAKYHTGNTFYVTEIGCGLAGYKPKDIAPLFAECINLKNVKLPQRFWHKLSGSNSR